MARNLVSRSMTSFSQRFAEIPAPLVTKVNGDNTEAGFVYIGTCIADAIEKEAGNLTNFRSILDFGCGLGRVTAQMSRRAPEADIVGFDIDPMMLHWAGHLLDGGRSRFVSTTLDLPDGGFDLIVVVSVFTHLDTTTDYWLTEIHRLLGPHGRAFITYHDETLYAEMAEKGQFHEVATNSILREKYVVGERTAEGGAAMGTFYTTAKWEQLVERYFKVERTVPRGLFGHQSYSVVSKKDVQLDRAPLYRQYLGSLEKELFDLRRQHQVSY
jgi:ubiquinone/menaquinone biosynthesis C-methylase UbiE